VILLVWDAFLIIILTNGNVILLVWDSFLIIILTGSEDTRKIVDQLQKEGYKGISIYTRTPSEGKGLSSAVVLGIEKTKYSTVLVMDADLQHEPESVPDVAFPVLVGDADFSVGSRNVIGGGIGGDWSVHRRILSRGATLLALPLTPCTDPMSGFFAIDKAVFNSGKHLVNPIGYKIGLELMVRCRIPASRQKDVPITFRDREAGESKLDMRQNIYYLQHLAILYWFAFPYLVLFMVLLGCFTLFMLYSFLF